jgi:hypothetical protein
VTLDEPERYAERFPLNGDPRLDFWRQAYLTALPALIAQLGPTAGDSSSLTLAARGAMAVADLAVSFHLQRCDRERLDLVVDNAVAWNRQFDESVPK